jgi:hypothetical protein
VCNPETQLVLAGQQEAENGDSREGIVFREGKQDGEDDDSFKDSRPEELQRGHSVGNLAAVLGNLHRACVMSSGNMPSMPHAPAKAEHTNRAGNTDHGNNVGLGPGAVSPLEGLHINLSGNRGLENHVTSYMQTLTSARIFRNKQQR